MEQQLNDYRYIVEIVLNKLRIRVNRDEFFQVGLIALWRALEKFDPALGKKESYLYMQVTYYVMNELKRKYLQLEREVQDEELFLYLPQEDEEYVNDVELAELLNTLKEDDRKLIEYTYFHGYKAKEVAKILGIAEITVKKRKKRILDQLRALIEREQL